MSLARLVTRVMSGLLIVGLSGDLAAFPDEQGKDDLPAPKSATKAVELRPTPPSLLNAASSSIDLPSAFRLAGVQNPEILLARERIAEADAARQWAAAQVLPSVNAGTNLDVHIGPLQRATGQIITENRGSLYLGLGANAVGAGTVTIPGVVWNGNVSETIFGVLVAKQVVREREFGSEAVQNDVLLRVAVAYLDLLRAEGRRAVAMKTRDEAHELARVTASFATTGQGRQADADRAAEELDQRDDDVLRSESDVLTASARLCQLLDLDPTTRLHVTDASAVPSPIVPDPIPVCELVAIALTRRPELKERQAAIQAALLALHGARVLPFAPNLLIGYSAGTFGGGSNLASDGIVQANGTVLTQPRFDRFAGREDIDTVVYWSLRNLGIGNLALIRAAQSQVRSQQLRELEVLDRVRAEVVIAHARAHARYAQIDVAERAVRTGQRALEEDLTRTRNREGLPIEVLDSLRLLGRSRYAYLDAIIDYNRAQFELYVALGQPPAATLARPVPEAVLSPVSPLPSKTPPKKP